MKIGILTLHSQLNYGGILQAFALQESLRSLGHQVQILDRRLPIKTMACYLGEEKRDFTFKQWLGYVIRKFMWMDPECVYRRGRKTKVFLNKWLHLSDFHFTCWKEVPPEKINVDCLIIGSDQVWHYWPFRPQDLDVYLLKDAPIIPALSYAASIGMTEFPKEILNDYIDGFNRFRAISVREREAVAQLATLGFRSTHVVDPTILLNPSVWRSLTHWNPQRQRRLFCYFMVDDFTAVFPALQHFVRETGCPVDVFFTDSLVAPKLLSCTPNFLCSWFRWHKALWLKNRWITLHFDAAPDEFLQCVSQATDLVSDSFHALMFSIIFKINVRILRPHTAMRKIMFARIEEFANYTTLGNLIAENLENALQSIQHAPPVIFEEEKIEELRTQSLQWLEKQLKEIEKGYEIKENKNQ